MAAWKIRPADTPRRIRPPPRRPSSRRPPPPHRRPCSPPPLPRPRPQPTWRPPADRGGSASLIFGVDRPGHRALVLRHQDARSRSPGHRVGHALASPPDRAGGVDRVRRDEAEPVGDGRADAPDPRNRLEPGRRFGDGPGLAGRLAPAGRRPLRRGPRHGRLGSGDRAGPLASRPRAPLPRAPAIAGPGRRASHVPGPPLRPRPDPPLRGRPGTGTTAGAGRFRSRTPQ